jgi:ribonucleoside-diphosphate reductase alpha subunit
MFVIKRSGETHPMKYDAITERNKKLAKDLIGSDGTPLDVAKLSQQVIQGLKSGMTTVEIDELAAETAAYMSSYEPVYDTLAARIAISNLHKSTNEHFVKTMKRLHDYASPEGRKYGLINDDAMKFMTKHREQLESVIDYSRDFNYTYFGFKTLERSYLHRIDGKTVERPQHMLMRVAVGIHGAWSSTDPKSGKRVKHEGDIEKVLTTYNELSMGKFTHATPTLYNACSTRPQLSSCFLLHMDDDLNHIYETNLRCALISKYAGGIGVDINKVRSKGSKIHSTNGISDGIVPMVKVFNATATYCNQCLAPETVVYSKAGFKRMDEITTEDELITHDGSFKKVNEVIINEKDEDIFEIKISGGCDTLKCTKEHDIYVIKDTGNSCLKRLIPQLESGSKKPEFIRADELKEKYYMGFPVPTYEKDIHTFSEDQCRLYGIMLGDGSIISNSDGYSYRYQFSLNKTTKINTFNFVIEYLTKNNINYYIQNEAEICFAYKKNLNVLGITIDMLYDKDKHKYLVTDYLHLPKNKVAKILKGLFESDGFMTDTGIFFSNTDKNLIYSIRYLLLRFGILSSVSTVNRIGQTASINKRGKPIIFRKLVYSYSLRVPKVRELIENDIYNNFVPTKVNQTYFNYKNILYTRIKKISKIKYSGKVYDFNMIDNHNYLTDTGLVHNSGRRKGSIAMYMQPYHPDVFDFLQLRLNAPPEEIRARDIFLAMWIPDIFMRRVEDNAMWSLICPSREPRLNETYGTEFDEIYLEAEAKGLYTRQVKARDVWEAILKSQEETGLPYMLYKDSVNNKSNQKNIGIIRSSNLCCEVLLYTEKDSVAVCNLASIALPKYVEKKENETVFNYEELGKIVEIIVDNLNNVIDRNFYPIPEAERNNLAYRPIGLGVQGLADVFAMLNLPWESQEAKELNQRIFETIYYHAVKRSIELALRDGSYSAFEGSPASRGELQYHMWNVKPITQHDWNGLEEKVKTGLRNSVLISPMPTASTAQILGNNEAFEPFTSNIYSRSVLSGNFICVNRHLYECLKAKKLWNKQIVDKIIGAGGSVQSIKEIPDDIKRVYRTVWEISQKTIIDMAADRGAFIDQTQSMNIFMERPTKAKLTSMHFYGWRKGLKTGSYYIRSKAAREAIKFTIDKEVAGSPKSGKMKEGDPETECTMCSS